MTHYTNYTEDKQAKHVKMGREAHFVKPAKLFYSEEVAEIEKILYYIVKEFANKIYQFDFYSTIEEDKQ